MPLDFSKLSIRPPARRLIYARLSQEQYDKLSALAKKHKVKITRVVKLIIEDALKDV